MASGASFDFGFVPNIRLSLQPRGHDNEWSNRFAAAAFGLDFADLTTTGAFVGGYTLKMALALEAAKRTGHVEGLILVSMNDSAEYLMVQQFTGWVDRAALVRTVLSDWSADRMGYDPGSGELYWGLDTTISASTLVAGNWPTLGGAYVSTFIDALQVGYDLLRLSGAVDGYSLVMRWR